MGSPILTNKHFISISENDCSGFVKPIVVFNYMQDLAAKSIATYNESLSCESLLDNGCGWFLIRYRVEFFDYYKPVNEIEIKTEFRGKERLNTYRDFVVYNSETNEVMLKAKTSWLIVNLQNKSLVNLDKSYPDIINYEKREDDLALQKLKSFNDYNSEKFYGVLYDDLDVNNHVNNSVYISWALNSLDYDFRQKHRFKAIDIYFKHESKYGDKIVVQTKYDSDKTYHVIKNADTLEELCLLSIEYVQ